MNPHSYQQTTEHHDEKVMQLVIAKLGDQVFGAPIQQVLEVLRDTHITPIPNSLEFIAGIANVHGEMALIIDLSRYLSLSKTPNHAAKHIMMIRCEKELYGLLVDEVTQIIRVPIASIKPTPDLLQQINRSYISGVYAPNENQVIMIFNLDVILSTDELIKVRSVK